MPYCFIFRRKPLLLFQRESLVPRAPVFVFDIFDTLVWYGQARLPRGKACAVRTPDAGALKTTDFDVKDENTSVPFLH